MKGEGIGGCNWGEEVGVEDEGELWPGCKINRSIKKYKNIVIRMPNCRSPQLTTSGRVVGGVRLCFLPLGI